MMQERWFEAPGPETNEALEARARNEYRAYDERVRVAAEAYVAARKANEAASADSWATALTNVDYAWHRLLVACGYDEEQAQTDAMD